MDIVSFIKNNPQLADRRAKEWDSFVKTHSQMPPFLNKGDFTRWALEKGIDPDVWVGKEITDAYFEVRETEEDSTINEENNQAGREYNTSSSLGLLSLPFLALLYKNQVLENDPKFKKILDEKKKEWLKNNPGKDFSGKEGLDFLYGDFKNPDILSAYQLSEKEFREKFGKEAKKYDKRGKNIYGNVYDDPVVQNFLNQTENELRQRMALFEKQGNGPNSEEFTNFLKSSRFLEFAKRYPAKAKYYSEVSKNRTLIHDQFAKAYQKFDTQKHLDEYKEKNIKYVEKSHNEQNKTSITDTTGTLENLSKSTPSQFIDFNSFQQQSDEDDKNNFQVPRRLLEEIEGEPANKSREIPQKRSNQISRNVINRANNLSNKLRSKMGSRATKLAGNVGKKVAQGIGKAAISNPYVLAVIVIILLIIVFIIVITQGGGKPVVGTTPTDITSCTFYRGGDNPPGANFQIAEWPSLISDVSSKVGVPASVVAGLLRVECGSCLSTSDSSYIQNDYDSHTSGVAYGVMQFTPGTFVGTFQANQAEMQEKFGKTSVSTTIYPQNNMELDSVFRIYSIKDSVIASAFKIRADAGINPPYTQTVVNDIAALYFSGKRLPAGCTKYPNCNTGPYDYGDDLWKSYNECVQSGTSLVFSTIVEAAQNIIRKLTKGPDNYYDAKLDEGITGTGNDLYWCTYLVVDSYNAVGVKDLTRANHGAVINMKNAFNSSTNLWYLDYNNNHSMVLQRVQPGNAMFQMSDPNNHTGNEHVAIVKTKDIDTNGNGFIETYDSNSSRTSIRYVIDNWKITNYIYTYIGFGGRY